MPPKMCYLAFIMVCAHVCQIVQQCLFKSDTLVLHIHSQTINNASEESVIEICYSPHGAEWVGHISE